MNRGGHMKNAWIGCALVALPFLLGADEKPIDEGDMVYIAVKFMHIEHPMPVSGARMVYDMPACKALTVRKADAANKKWTVEDPLGNQEQLEGAWAPLLFKTEAECQDYVKSHGAREVSRSGKVFPIK
jgi:hypothetical protein